VADQVEYSHDIRLPRIEGFRRRAAGCRKKPSGGGSHSGIHTGAKIRSIFDIESDPHAVSSRSRSEQLELGQSEMLRVEADEAASDAGRQGLRRLRIEMQADRRLPGLQCGDQIGAVLIK
jgi:hypothetical protein